MLYERIFGGEEAVDGQDTANKTRIYEYRIACTAEVFYLSLLSNLNSFLVELAPNAMFIGLACLIPLHALHRLHIGPSDPGISASGGG